MDWDDKRALRIGLITTLAANSPSGQIGRTSLMKFCYFLQVLGRVPLGYNFTLYSYGPFDSEVLSDLNSAESIGAVVAPAVSYPNGSYGYEIREGKLGQQFRDNPAITEYKSAIDWVLEKFGNYVSPDLELLSTIVYVDREAGKRKEALVTSDLVQRVRDVKPRFAESEIEEKVDWLRKEKLLRHTSDR